MVLFQKCVRWFGSSIKMASTAELNLTWDPMGNSHTNLLLRSHWANCNQTFVEWSLDGPLPKCVRWSRLPTKMAAKLKLEKRGDEIKKKIFSSETTEPISSKLCWNDPWVVPFQNCVRQRRPVSKMATITKNRNFFKWPKLLYFKPESAKIWTV